MSEENKNNEKEIPGNLFEMLNCFRKKREETLSEKIMKLALERDKVYDRCKSLSAESNFICDFILGKKQEIGQLSLF